MTVRRIEWLVCGFVLIIGIVFRFTALGRIPTLDHDEALICLGARSIVETGCFTLTGDKVYEGPLFETMLAGPMALFGASDVTARSTVAVIGCLALAALILAGRALDGGGSGVLAAMILALSPWHLAASRVIYACNVSILVIPLWIWAYLRFVQTTRLRFALIAAGLIGLAANGRFTAWILLIPLGMVILRYRRPHRLLTLAGTLALVAILSLPVLAYNAIHGWPAVAVLAGAGQHHLLKNVFEYPSRVGGLVLTLLHALTGSGWWIDAATPVTSFTMVIPAAALAGCIGMLTGPSKKQDPGRWLVLVVGLLLAVVPAVTKSLGPDCGYRYHPHYLDLIMPVAALCAGHALSTLARRHRWPARLIILGISGLQLHLLMATIVPSIKQYGAPGRWNNAYKQIAGMISATYTPDTTRVAASWSFGSGYPQTAFYLPQFKVDPVIQRVFGHRQEQGEWDRTLLVHVSSNPSLYKGSWRWKRPSGDTGSGPGLWSVASPGMEIAGYFFDSTGSDVLPMVTWQRNIASLWPDIVVFGTRMPVVLTVDDREFETQTVPAMVRSIPRVTPRHQPYMLAMARWVVAHRLKCRDESGNSWALTWGAEPGPDGTVDMSIVFPGGKATGRFDGLAVFH
ncbi:glycosyltransferase family 39 protein [bacterium]|nr:glycosyltransferase family 39 protein [candidate division CSSED10-310 bacterium]